jgi:kynurenine formamidase
MDDISTRTGFTKVGIEKVGTLITRGVLIDVAALKGADMLADTYEITVADLQQALQRQQLTLQPGDAVILHTGWGRLWGKENDRYMKTNPGIDVAASEWLARQDPMLIGADTAPINVTPSPDPKLSNPVHQIALVVNGIFLLENLRLDELAAQRAYEFALIVEPLKLVGATGSTVAPIAVR